MNHFYIIIAWILVLLGMALNIAGDVPRSQVAILAAIVFALFAIYTDNQEAA